MQSIDSRLIIAINKKINGFLRVSVSGMKNPGALPGFPLFSFYFYFTGWGITTMPLAGKLFLFCFLLVDVILEG
jgi:hypothetical protein